MILKISVAASIAAAVMIAFLFVRSTDEVVPRGTTELITVWDVGSRVTRSEARALISRLAATSDMTLYKSVVSPDDGTSRRTLYVMHSTNRSGGYGERQSYADIARSTTTRLARGAISRSQLSEAFTSRMLEHLLRTISLKRSSGTELLQT